MKVLSVVGTRPELIRLSEVIRKLDEHTHHIFVHTNQSYDYELNQIFFDELKIRKPDYSLDVKSETVGEQIGKILTQTEQVMLKEKPDLIVILGDTNSALSCIVAKRLKIPIYHIEAGNRSFDDRVPEEINRRIVDHTSDINICYSEHARRNLLREGLPSQSIFVLGTPLIDVYARYRVEIENSNILKSLELDKGKYFLASIHREENINDGDARYEIFKTFNLLVDKYGIPLILSAHPRTRERINGFLKLDRRIMVCKPFGMFDYIKLQQNCLCNLSDSGTAHEDAAIFGIPTVIIREANERQEVYDRGNVIMSGLDPDMVVKSVELVKSQPKFSNPYFGEGFADKVLRLMMQYKVVCKKEYYV